MCSAFVKMLSQGGGSYISGPTLWFPSMRSAASSNGSTTPLDFDTFSPSCIRREVSSQIKTINGGRDKRNNNFQLNWYTEITQCGCICLCFQGIYLSGKELRKLILPKTAPFEEKLRIHKEVLCARHIPVFHEWFLRTFPDPTSWYDPPYTPPTITFMWATVSQAESIIKF